MLSDEESAELGELRRRAWGESPDILEDEAGLARLQELEGKARPEEPDLSASPDRSPSGLEEPVVERARNDRDETWSEQPRFDSRAPVLSDRRRVEGSLNRAPQEDALLQTEPTPRKGAGRGILLVLGVVITVVAFAAGVRSILNPSSPPAAASPSPTFAFATPRTLPAPQCGDGWGLASSLSTPPGKPVWSRQFDFPISETWVMPVRGARMVGVWANLDVDPGTIADVEVVSPTTARLFYTAVTTWTAPPSPDEIIANSKQSIVLPVCGSADSYPGFILARAPACVTLEFTIAGTAHYTVRTPVGLDEGAHCPAR